MLTDTPGGTISAIKKPLSASIRSPDLKCSSTPDFCTIALSDVDPGNNLPLYHVTLLEKRRFDLQFRTKQSASMVT